MVFETALFGYRKSVVDAHVAKLVQQSQDKEDRIRQLEAELHRATHEMYDLQDEIRVHKQINQAIAKWKNKES